VAVLLRGKKFIILVTVAMAGFARRLLGKKGPEIVEDEA
jgi:hypothetical protein